MIKHHIPSIDDVEVPRCMTAPEVLYALNIVQGHEYWDAYRIAIGPRAKGKTQDQLSKGAYRFKKKPLVQNYIKSMMREIERVAVANSLELQVFLTAVIYTPIGHIDEFSPLCQKKTTTTTTIRHKDGSETETEKVIVEMPNKHACSQLLARIRGIEKPIQVDHNHRGGVMVVPMTASVEEWERLAANSQKELMADAIEID